MMTLSLSHPRTQSRNIFLVFAFAAVSSLPAQFKYSAGISLGVMVPNVSDFNAVLSDSNLKAITSIWLPFGYDFSVKIYPSLRVGYVRLSSALIPNKSSENFSMVITMNGISVQTFFAFLKRFEADFGIVPLLGKASFTQKEIAASTSPFRAPTSTRAGIHNSFFAYYTWIGLRFHLLDYLAAEGTLGFFKEFFNKDKWKKGSDNLGLSMDLDYTRPLFRFGVVLGW